MRRWKATGSASAYIIHVIGIGFVIAKTLSLGQLRIDDTDSPGWARLPDCPWAIGAFAVSMVGFAPMMAVCTLVPARDR